MDSHRSRTPRGAAAGRIGRVRCKRDSSTNAIGRYSRRRRPTFCGLVLVALCSLAAASASVEAVEMPADVVGSAGDVVTSTNHRLGFTAGLPVCGFETSPNYDETVGFWHWVSEYVSDAGDGGLVLPRVTQLSLTGPNPFATMTTLRYEIAENTAGSSVRLEIFDVNGRSVSVLVDGPKPAGAHTVVWNRESRSGQGMANGIYFAHFRAGGYEKTLRLVAAC